ncbi:hypothetical protein [Clostridium sp.]|uniref:hypothetical protein n=1 Tax=Clostridium sp. TaxID=1506 RepID=UPI003217F6D5
MEVKNYIKKNYNVEIDKCESYETFDKLIGKNSYGKTFTFRLGRDGKIFKKNDLSGQYEQIKGILFRKE